MADTNTSGAQAAPANSPAQPSPGALPAPAAGAAAPAAAGTPTQSADPNWLNGRIAQAKQSAQADVLKQLGVTDLAAAQAAIRAANEAAERNKSDAQRVTELQAQLTAEKERGDVYEETLKERAASELAALPDAQREAVLALAGDDVGAQILAIDTLKPTWTGAAPAGAPVTPPKPAPVTNTAPPREAPAPTPGSEPDHYQKYIAIREKNPFAAARYRQQHPVSVADGEARALQQQK